MIVFLGNYLRAWSNSSRLGTDLISAPSYPGIAALVATTDSS